MQNRIGTPPIAPPSRKDIEDAIVRAFEAIKSTRDKALKSDVNVGDTLAKYSDQLQGFVNTFLSKRGAITQQQLDELDEQVRLTKLKTLQAESKNTFVRYGIFISVAFVAFGALWLITREKKQNG